MEGSRQSRTTGLATLSAHEVTHNGAVVPLKTAKYAQPSGGSREVRELEVASRVFTITDKTKITRAGKQSRMPR